MGTSFALMFFDNKHFVCVTDSGILYSTNRANDDKYQNEYRNITPIQTKSVLNIF